MQKYGELLLSLLEKRGIKDEEQADFFLNPDYEKGCHDPFLMRDMDKACDRIFSAIDSNEKIVIYADYDCDGIPGAVVLTDLFKEIGFENFSVYIPLRNAEGYGLSKEALETLAKEDVKLIITVDLGITAHEEVSQAKKDGIDVIVTDHHLAQNILPEAFAILNPKVDDYPEKMLCGAGVAFKLAQGFLKKYGEYFGVRPGVEKWMLDMVGLATLSDMVPLLGENRVFAHYGIFVMRKSRRAGLQQLLSKIGVEQKHLTEDDVLFMVTPRLNAASRMDNPMRAFELLSTSSLSEAGALADHLSKINDERKNIVKGIMREVNKKLETREIREVIVVGNVTWKVGVLGLVAGKICDIHEKPVFVWGRDENDTIKGSCRSDGSVSVVELMTEAKEHFLDFGGHELAGGFTLEKDSVHFLEEKLSESFARVRKIDSENKDSFDLNTGLDVVNLKTWNELSKLAPFGLANEKPIFKFSSVLVDRVKKFGKKNSMEHLEILFKSGDYKAVAVAFFADEDSFSRKLKEKQEVDLLATLELSRFRGKTELRLRIVDII